MCAKLRPMTEAEKKATGSLDFFSEAESIPTERKPLKIFSRECFFIPERGCSKDLVQALKKKYSFYFYDDKVCSKCENGEYRVNGGEPLPECKHCAAFQSGMELSKRVKIKDRFYYTAPDGDEKGLVRLLRSHGIEPEIICYQKDVPIAPINLTADLYPYQEEAVATMIKAEKGVLKAPPRSGKTVMAAALVARLHKKTLIIASQREWLIGFQETFIGSKTQKGFTDLDPKRIGFCKELEDFEKYDICLATVQTFYAAKNAQEVLRKIRTMFSVVVVDEVHTSAASMYAQVMSRIACMYKIGLTGTPDRKDGKYVLTEAIFGKIAYEAKVKSLVPQVRLVKTEYSKVIGPNVPFAYITGPLERDKARQKLIAEYAIKDVRDGHVVLIPYSGIKAIHSQVALINQMAGTEIAKAFTGATKNRAQLIEDARTKKVKVIVGTISLLSTGINIPTASALYETVIRKNFPASRQRFSRILTPYDDKPQPIIRYFLDDMDIRRVCMAGEFWQVLMREIHPIISDIDLAALKSYFSQKTQRQISYR